MGTPKRPTVPTLIVSPPPSSPKSKTQDKSYDEKNKENYPLDETLQQVITPPSTPTGKIHHIHINENATSPLDKELFELKVREANEAALTSKYILGKKKTCIKSGRSSPKYLSPKSIKQPKKNKVSKKVLGKLLRGNLLKKKVNILC